MCSRPRARAGPSGSSEVPGIVDWRCKIRRLCAGRRFLDAHVLRIRGISGRAARGDGVRFADRCHALAASRRSSTMTRPAFCGAPPSGPWPMRLEVLAEDPMLRERMGQAVPAEISSRIRVGHARGQHATSLSGIRRRGCRVEECRQGRARPRNRVGSRSLDVASARDRFEFTP